MGKSVEVKSHCNSKISGGIDIDDSTPEYSLFNQKINSHEMISCVGTNNFMHAAYNDSSLEKKHLKKKLAAMARQQDKSPIFLLL